MESGSDKVRIAVSDQGKGFELSPSLSDLAAPKSSAWREGKSKPSSSGATRSCGSAPDRGTAVAVEAPL